MSMNGTSFLVLVWIETWNAQSYVVPVIKDKHGDASDADHYIGIAVSSTISKALELIMRDKLHGKLMSSQQQFGFKKVMDFLIVPLF